MELAGDHVEAGLKVRNDVALGQDSRAVIKITTILGSRYLALQPAGPGALPDNTFDLAHTEVPYDLQEALADVTTTYEQVDSDQFAQTLAMLGEQLQGLPAGGAAGAGRTPTPCRRSSPTAATSWVAAEDHRTGQQHLAAPAVEHRQHGQPGQRSGRRVRGPAGDLPRDDGRADQSGRNLERHRHRRPAGAGEPAASTSASSPTCWASTTICCAAPCRPARSRCGGWPTPPVPATRWTSMLPNGLLVDSWMCAISGRAKQFGMIEYFKDCK